MKLSKPSLLLHPIFIINLLVLLANDLWWKYAYTSWLTGKLSDFSGIFVFTVLLNAVFPGRKIYTATCTVVFFTWWKSSFSDAFIEWANTVLQWPVHRTIDYSDLIALIVIPAAG